MAIVVGVHGIAQQVQGPVSGSSSWRNWMLDGLALSSGDPVELGPQDVRVAHWGDLFRPRPSMSDEHESRSDRSSAAEGGPEPTDREADASVELLVALWEGAAATEGLPGPDSTDKFRTWAVTQRALARLAQSRFFAGVAQHLLWGDLRQVTAYLGDDTVRGQVQARLEKAVGEDTQVLVGHSLGSVVAYEALVAHPEWQVRHLITLGSPLGIPRLVFDRLQPPPRSGVGVWPEGLRTWTNIADDGDVVALRKELGAMFPGVRDVRVHNGAQAHDVAPYLTAIETGSALRRALTETQGD